MLLQEAAGGIHSSFPLSSQQPCGIGEGKWKWQAQSHPLNFVAEWIFEPQSPRSLITISCTIWVVSYNKDWLTDYILTPLKDWMVFKMVFKNLLFHIVHIMCLCFMPAWYADNINLMWFYKVCWAQALPRKFLLLLLFLELPPLHSRLECVTTVDKAISLT